MGNKQDKLTVSTFQLNSINSRVGASCHVCHYGPLYFMHIYGSAALNQNESTPAFKFQITGNLAYTGESIVGPNVVTEFKIDQTNLTISLNSDTTQTAWINGITMVAF